MSCGTVEDMGEPAPRMPEPHGGSGQTCAKCGQAHERMGRPTCRAHTRRGTPCMTLPIVGAQTCRMHGSATKAARKKAATNRVMSFKEGAIKKLLLECDVPEQHPLDGLLEVVRHSGAMTRMLAGLVGELATHPNEAAESWSMNEDGELVIQREGALYGPDHMGDAAPSVLVHLYGVWSDRYARACKLALDANIDERLVRNAEATSETLFAALGKALEAADLTPVQRGKLRGALAQELRRHVGPGVEV